MKPIRVTFISGFLGSGKTTLLRRLLRRVPAGRLGVIVNDMSELEVDGDLLRGARVSEKAGSLVSLHSGSISGARREAFAAALAGWETREDLEHVIVETSGSSHPGPLVAGVRRHPRYVLDTFATLVDARAFVEDYGAGRLLFERLVRNEETGVRSLENLLAAQIQAASVLLLTKTDRVDPQDLVFVTKSLELLNPAARIHTVARGEIEPNCLLGSGTFGEVHVRQLAAACDPALDAAGSSSSGGLGSSVISDARPFHPQRLWHLFHHRLSPGIHRSKGFIWLASRDDQVLLWNQAAGSIGLELLAYWKAAVVKDPLNRLLPEEKQALARQLETAHPHFGDRLNELTVIGTLDARETFVPELQRCFCTAEEITRWQQGGSFEDPWPQQLRQVS